MKFYLHQSYLFYRLLLSFIGYGMLSLGIFCSVRGNISYAQNAYLSSVSAPDTVTARIYFRCAKSMLDSAYRDNGASLIRLQEVLGSKDSTCILGVTVSSAASPEGNLRFNRLLSDARAQTAAEAVAKLTGVSPEMIRIISSGEDWAGLYKFALV